MMLSESAEASVWLSYYQELKTWQTGLGALLGFVALMIAALWNFRLNRQRDADLRRDEARAVAAAINGGDPRVWHGKPLSATEGRYALASGGARQGTRNWPEMMPKSTKIDQK